MEAIGLYQLNSLVKRELKNRFPDSFLVIAEIADVKKIGLGIVIWSWWRRGRKMMR